MKNSKILTIQDISCVGQCSLTVALPILSACGLETAILPSAVLSTHTAFKGFTFRDLTDDMPSIIEHWDKENIRFSCVYTGYLGSVRQIDIVKNVFGTLLADDGLRIVDPAMADNGKLYVGFDDAFVAEMAELASEADILLPNITEASLLTGLSYREHYDALYVDELLSALHERGTKTVVLTGVSYDSDTTGVVVSEIGKEMQYYRHEKLSRSCHGTGDVYASAFTGAMMNGKTPYEAAVIAANYTLACMKNTASDPEHWYGVKFEGVLHTLIDALK